MRKMRKDVEKRLLARGFDTELIQKIEVRSLNLTSLRAMNKEALKINEFTEEEADLIISKVKRNPIDTKVLEAILFKSGEVCCYCADGDSTRPFHIHHINEHYISGDDSEENLLLVCPNDHANIHSKNIPIEEQKAVKRAWENVWHIGQEYKKNGITFPYGSFEVIDYEVKGSIVDIFSFASPGGSVCRELANGDITEQCLNTLNQENKLVIAGGSGSGKTTL